MNLLGISATKEQKAAQKKAEKERKEQEKLAKKQEKEELKRRAKAEKERIKQEKLAAKRGGGRAALSSSSPVPTSSRSAAPVSAQLPAISSSLGPQGVPPSSPATADISPVRPMDSTANGTGSASGLSGSNIVIPSETNYSSVPSLAGMTPAAAVGNQPSTSAPTNYSEVPAFNPGGLRPAPAVAQARPPMGSAGPSQNTNYSSVPAFASVASPAAQQTASSGATNYSTVPEMSFMAPASAVIPRPSQGSGIGSGIGGAPSNYSEVPALTSVAAAAAVTPARTTPIVPGNYSDVPKLSELVPASAQRTTPVSYNISLQPETNPLPLLSDNASASPAPLQAPTQYEALGGLAGKVRGYADIPSVPKQSARGTGPGYSDLPESSGQAAAQARTTDSEYDIKSAAVDDDSAYLSLDDLQPIRGAPSVTSGNAKQPTTDTQYKALPSDFYRGGAGVGPDDLGGGSTGGTGGTGGDGMYASLPDEDEGGNSTTYESLGLGAVARSQFSIAVLRELREVDAEARGVVKYLRNVEKMADVGEVMAGMTYLIDRVGAILAARQATISLEHEPCVELRRAVSSFRDRMSDISTSGKLARFLKHPSLRTSLLAGFESILIWMNTHFAGTASNLASTLAEAVPNKAIDDASLQWWIEVSNSTSASGFALDAAYLCSQIAWREEIEMGENECAIFREAVSFGTMITFPKYAELCRAFGTPGSGLLRRFLDLMALPYFFGFVSREDSERILASESERTFLVRFSGLKLDTYVLVVKKQRASDHVLIEMKYPQRMYELTVSMKGKFEPLSFATLDEAIHYLLANGILSSQVVADYIQTPTFHGDLTVEDLDTLFEGMPVGTFIIRWSTTAGCFTISLYKGPGVVQHSRIIRSPTGYRENETGREYSSIPMLLEVNGSRLEHPLPGKLGSLCYYSSLISSAI